MNKKKMFGCRKWFIKNAIYNMLIEDKDYFGIDAIEYNNKLELNEEEISARYKLCNLIKKYLIGETYISNTDIMAVLYKIDFAIVEGRLKSIINYEDRKKDIQDIAFEESLKLGEEELKNMEV